MTRASNATSTPAHAAPWDIIVMAAAQGVGGD
jgi:hypothetical protein